MQMAIDKLEALKAQTTVGSNEETYYQTLIDRFTQLIVA